MAHRGPDARGVKDFAPVYLGHNRLSIIDLSEDGTQPLENFDCAITFNGEIYNYVELKEELIAKGYQFRTKTDTEVIIAAYREYGTSCVLRFMGMWSFAILDKRDGSVFCSRDRFGIKPFYYFHNTDGFYFASEYKAFYQVPSFTKDLNLAQVSRALQLGWLCYGEETFFNNIRSILPGHNLIYKSGSFRQEKYWELTTSDQLQPGDPEELAHMIDESVRLHMRSDVEVAVCLSGGVDSSVLSSSIGTQFPGHGFRTFSIYYEGKGEVDERPFMREVVSKYPAITPDYYSPPRDRVFEKLDEIIHMADVPITGSSNISHYFLTERIHQNNIKVVLDGQGVDEYAGGYMHSWYRFIADLMRQGRVGAMISELSYYSKYQHASAGAMVSLLGKSALSLVKGENALYNFEYDHFYPRMVSKDLGPVLQLPNVQGDKLQQFSYQLLYYSSLPTILHYVDRMTMAHSLESRVPFLDHRLVEYVHRLDDRYKIRNGESKWIVREAAKKILPQKIYERRDKKGFVTPGETHWLRGELKSMLDLNYAKLDFIDKAAAEKAIADYKGGNNKNAKLVWRLAMLNRWMQLNNL